MTTKHLNESEISQYIDFVNNEVYSVDNDINNHIEECFECKHKIIKLLDIIKTSETLNSSGIKNLSIEKNKVKKPKLSNNIAKIAAILIFVTLSSVSFDIVSKTFIYNNYVGLNQLAFNNSHELDYKTTAGKNISLQNDNNSMYVKSSYLESFIESGYRSANITVVSPKPNQSINKKQSLVFKFNGKTNEEITLDILNNNEKKVYSNRIDKELILANNNFPKGLYYYKLTTENDLLYVGKFNIK